MTHSAQAPTTGGEDPRGNPVLFKRIRAWLQDSENTGRLEPRLQQVVAPMLADLKARKVLLLFGRVDPYSRDVRRSSTSLDQGGEKIIELYIGGLRCDDDHFEKMNGRELEFLAVDAVDLYAKHWGPKMPVRAPAAPAPV